MNIVAHGSKEKISKFNIIRKFLIFVIFAIMATPAFATPNWVQIDNNTYIDTNSLRKENYSNSNYNNYYSIWVKFLNDGSKPFLDTEIYYKTKILYSLHQYYVDCKNKRADFKSYVIYDLENSVVAMNTFDDYNLPFDNIAPGTIGERIYDYICVYSKGEY